MPNDSDPLVSAHPYLVACELATPHNSLRALLMACMMKAEGPSLQRLISAFPNVHADLIGYQASFRNKGGRR